MLKILFYTYNSILLILYLYPGSILGFFVYNDISRQPQITSDLFFLGYFSIKKIKYLIFYLFFISIFLELSHLIIPNRSFQFSDLFGNIIGIILPTLLIFIYKKTKNEHL